MEYLKHLWIKKRIALSFLLPVFLFCSIQKSFSQVGVNILTPHSSAAMQVQSPGGSFKGLLTPSMTTSDRINVTNGNQAADGLIVYDVDHRMHYYYNKATNRWNSMSPLTLSTSTSIGQPAYPTGVITTPSTSLGSFSLGINTQNPSQALHVVGNSTVSGNSNIGGNANITGNANLTGTLNVPGFPPNALVPAGIIVMWSGTVVPVGWGLCDGGTYGGLLTPDLRGKFVVGVNNFAGTMNGLGQHLVFGQSGTTPAVAPADGTTINYGTIGNTGGENGHALSVTEIPKHAHSLQPGVDGSNSSMNGVTIQDDISGFGGGAVFKNGNGSDIDNAIGNNKSHSHSLSGNTGDGTTAGLNNGVHENRPPYYVLAYIIKLP